MNRIVFSTTGSQEEARRIAQQLVERSLAACVNVLGPIESIYRWQGKVETAGEFLLLIKTTAERFPDVRDALVALHSYEVPECIAIDVADGSAPYLAWLADSVR
jgi:periplasmic divalent cation tolerance protein